jgi:NTE family protein
MRTVPKATPKYRIGLVLSGGGIRGVSHIGVIQALQELDLEPDVISGTSAGAIVGGLYASGCSIARMRQYWEDTQPFKLGLLTLSKPGLLDMDKISRSLEDYLGVETFEELQRPLHVTATELIAGETQTFSEGPVIPAIAASAAFPLIFSPVEIGEGLYQDGGILNNLPTDPLRDQCELIIGVNVSPLRSIERDQLDGILGVVERVYELATDLANRQRLPDCDVLIAPSELAEISTFDTSQAEDLFQVGYEATMAVKDELLQKAAT